MISPATARFDELRQRMVDKQLRARGIKDERVLAAMGAVPRHLFVPPTHALAAYEDTPLPIGHGQTISQPYVVALMTELLALKPGERVLEVGTGSGYQAAVLAAMGVEVYSIEIIEPLTRAAERAFAQAGYKNVHTRVGDGYQGWPEHAPFDAAIVTCAPEHIPLPLLDQLKPHGRIVIPLGGYRDVQELVLVKKAPNGELHRSRHGLVRFVPLVRDADGSSEN